MKEAVNLYVLFNPPLLASGPSWTTFRIHLSDSSEITLQLSGKLGFHFEQLVGNEWLFCFS